MASLSPSLKPQRCFVYNKQSFVRLDAKRRLNEEFIAATAVDMVKKKSQLIIFMIKSIKLWLNGKSCDSFVRNLKNGDWVFRKLLFFSQTTVKLTRCWSRSTALHFIKSWCTFSSSFQADAKSVERQKKLLCLPRGISTFYLNQWMAKKTSISNIYSPSAMYW